MEQKSSDVDSLLNLGTLNNTQPPSQNGTNHLNILRWVGASGASEGARKLAEFFAPGLGSCALQAYEEPEEQIGQRRSPTQGNAPEDAVAESGAVLHMLAAGEFWARTKVRGDLWDASEVLKYTIELSPSPTGKQWCFAPAGVKASDYAESVNAAYDAVTADPDVIRRIKGYAVFPQYAFALALIKPEANVKDYVSTLALLDVVPAVVSVAIQRLKQAIRVPRMDATSWDPPSAFKPVIDMPGFTAYPGGHAAVGHALAVVLSEVTGADATKLSALADRLGKDRELAGVHCAMDTEAGASIGKEMGAWLVEAGQLPDQFPAWTVMCERAKKEW